MLTGAGHFVQTQQMAEMLPDWVPERIGIIYATGLLELAGVIGLLIPRLSRTAGACLLVFLVLVFPVNIHAALNRVDMGGHALGPVYILIRGPLQLVLIGWTYWFAVRRQRKAL